MELLQKTAAINVFYVYKYPYVCIYTHEHTYAILLALNYETKMKLDKRNPSVSKH